MASSDLQRLPRAVLVVDDEEATIEVFQSSLVSEGFQVDGFIRSQEALDHFMNNYRKYAILVSGARVQPISSLDLVRKAKSIKPDIRAILSSPFEMNVGEIERVMPSLPVDKLVQKPVSPEQVVDIARRHFL